MAQRWRGEENRNFGGDQQPAYWDQDERGQQGQGGRRWQGRGDDDVERSGRAGQQYGGQQYGGQQYGGQRDYGGARFSRGMERDFDDMGAGDMTAGNLRGGTRADQDWPGHADDGGNYGGSQAGGGWRGNQSAFFGDERRDMPYSHGGRGHWQQWGQGGGQSSADQRDWQGDDPYGSGRYRRHFEGSGRHEQQYEQGGSRWGQFGGFDEETQGPRSQRGMGRWREQYGSGEDYGHGGGPAGQMDYGQGNYGRDMRGQHEQGGYDESGSWRGGDQQTGAHRGKGPKGYERSPERLKEDICERLTDAHDVDASEISVQVKDGIVALEGTVPDRKMKHRAEDIVEACSGVKDVENRLKVKGAMVQQSGQYGPQGSQPEQPGQQGTSNQNRLTGGGSLHH